MRFMTGCFDRSGPRKVLVVQRVAGKAKRSVLFAFLCEDETTVQVMEEWFYEDALQVCTKGNVRKCITAVQKSFCKRTATVDRAFSAVFSVEEECFYGWCGCAGMYLLNLCFNRLHRKSLTYRTEEVCVVRAQIEQGVGLVLGTEDFFAHLPEELLVECLAVDTLRSSSQIERHLKEAAEAAIQAGAREPAAILVVTDACDKMPAFCEQLLAVRGYTAEERIGGGAFGQVYRVRDRNNHQVLACKVACGFEEQSVLRQEAELLSCITHPLFPEYRGCLDGQTCTMLLMEYVKGENLADCLQKRILSQNQAVAVAMQLAEGIGYLHKMEEPVIYRDLKPEHVCLTKKGVRLMDLGCACEVSKARFTKAGSPGYAPVEQLADPGSQGRELALGNHGVIRKGQEAKPGFYSDVYALGKLLHYMLTGDNPCKPPYRKPPLRAYHKSFHPLLEQVVMECVELKPEHRIPDMQCLMQRLKPFV